MNSYTIQISLFILILLASCLSCKDKETDTAEDLFFASSPLCESKVLYDFIALETTENNLIGYISKIKIVQNKIFVLDAVISKTLQVYDLKGRYLQQVGAIGNGPGEYTTPNNFYIDGLNNVLLIINQSKSQIIEYDLNTLSYKKTYLAPFYFASAQPVSNGHFVWYQPMGYEMKRIKYYLQITERTLEDVTNYHYPIDFPTSLGLPSSQDVFYEYEDRSFFFLMHNPIIYEITPSGIQSKYRLKVEGHQFLPLDYLKSISENRTNNTVLASDYIVSYTFHEVKDWIFSSFLVNRQIKSGLFNKKEGKSFSLSSFEKEGKLMNLSLPFVGTYYNGFIGYIRPAEKNLEYLKKNIKEDISTEDNPILCLIKFQE